MIHAGENGLFGDEDRSVIIPAIAAARAEGIAAALAGDTVFMRARRASSAWWSPSSMTRG